MNTLINIGLIVAYVMLIAAAVALVAFPLLSLAKGKVTNVQSVVGIVLMLVAVLVVSYFISPADQGPFYTRMGTTPLESKLVGAALIATYFVFGALIIITLYTAIRKWLK